MCGVAIVDGLSFVVRVEKVGKDVGTDGVGVVLTTGTGVAVDDGRVVGTAEADDSSWCKDGAVFAVRKGALL